MMPVFLLILVAALDLSGEIAFLVGSGPDCRVCTLDLSTGTVAQVGDGPADGPPAWSPDGKKLAYTARRQTGREIVVIDFENDLKAPLVHSLPWNGTPRWSPDGARLAYSAAQSEHEALARRLMIYDLAANSETEWGGGRPGLLRPVWLDDARILAIMLVPTERELTMDIALVSEKQAMPLPPEALPSKQGRYAEWAVEPAPGGRSVAFESNDGGDREIFVFDWRKGAVDVSNHRAADWNPVWAPDGENLLFESFRGGRRGLYLVYPKTMRTYPWAVHPEYNNWDPTWSPDGQWAAFISDRDGNPELYVMDAPGRQDPVRLTRTPGPEFAPAWRPEPRE